MLSVDMLLVDKLSIDTLNMETLPAVILSVDMLVADKLLIDALFMDALFADKLLMDALFITAKTDTFIWGIIFTPFDTLDCAAKLFIAVVTYAVVAALIELSLGPSVGAVNETVKRGSASQATGLEPKATQQPIIESNDVYNRMRQLAGLI